MEDEQTLTIIEPVAHFANYIEAIRMDMIKTFFDEHANGRKKILLLVVQDMVVPKFNSTIPDMVVPKFNNAIQNACFSYKKLFHYCDYTYITNEGLLRSEKLRNSGFLPFIHIKSLDEEHGINMKIKMNLEKPVFFCHPDAKCTCERDNL